MYKNVLKILFFAAFSFFICYAPADAIENAPKNDNNSNEKVNKKDVVDRDIVVKDARKGGTYDENYFIGLKAYEDGFYDVAKSSVLEFLKKDSKSAQAGFATYLLYQIYMAEGDYKAAKIEFEKLKKFDDNRFDKNKMTADEMALAVKLDCKDAKKLLFSKQSDDQMKIYIGSGCPISQEILDYAAAMPFKTETVIMVIDKIKDDKEQMLKVYNNLSVEKRTPKLLNFYGHYFAVNKMYADFWRLFSEYKDADMVDIALDDIWNTADQNKYVDFFNKNINGYKLNNISYCRQIEASNKTAQVFDCKIVDGCLGVTNPQYKKTKLACYMKNEDKNGISLFMKDVTAGEAAKLCEYGKYIVIKNLYSPEFLGKFSSCPDKAGMYESLLKNKDYKGMINLAGKKREETDKAYLAIAYHLSGNKTEGDTFLQSVTDANLVNMVKSRIGATK